MKSSQSADHLSVTHHRLYTTHKALRKTVVRNVHALRAIICAVVLLQADGFSAYAQQSLALRDSFPIGNEGDVLCQVQAEAANASLQSPFERSWAIVCRDSALPVGYIYALRNAQGDAVQRADKQRAEKVDCAQSVAIKNKPNSRECRWREGNIPYGVSMFEKGKTLYIAEGFSPYQDAIDLAAQSIIADRIVKGEIKIVTTSVNDTEAFARIQALTLTPDKALAEGYRRNNSGDYADAAAFFEALQQRPDNAEDTGLSRNEFLINRGLQKSNLGDFAEADALFAEARLLPITDPVQMRLTRNYEAIHLINQGQYSAAITRLNKKVKPFAQSDVLLNRDRVITTPISGRINGSSRLGKLLSLTTDKKISPEERATIIDAQAEYLLATANRLNGNLSDVRRNLIAALNKAVAVRDGRVVSIIRLRAQILIELALLSEQLGDDGAAEIYFTSAIELVATQYPGTRALNATKAQLASYYVRAGAPDKARALYNEIVTISLKRRDPMTGFANQLAPYFGLLAADDGQRPEDAAEFFRATQILVRAGVAETQAILSRELSSGDDEAARLFRLSNNINRAIERRRIARAAIIASEDEASVEQRNKLAAEINELEKDQQVTLSKLADYPQYKVAANRLLGLDELQQAMKPGEGFLRLAIASDQLFVFFTDGKTQRAYKAAISASELEKRVDAIRDSISAFDPEFATYLTRPYAVEEAYTLYRDIFAPVHDRMRVLDHLIFEPDGAFLRLPLNLLVTDAESVERFDARLNALDGDPFDVSDVQWLGRDIAVSTAVSARAFVDARNAPVSKASQEYLGLGENAPVFQQASLTTLPRLQNAESNRCAWPLAEWNNPISAAELHNAQKLIGQNRSALLTGSNFTDSMLKSRADLADYRILHFATHGLVGAPRKECPARPALLTSFGAGDSDGLLSFKEIFDLRIDADLVILSACDTAGRATVSATREVGLSSGGGGSLDGLVRAFVGAGGRSIMASHWPAPDDYDATNRLITGVIAEGEDRSIWSALARAQRPLMDDPLTSHPYYWAGFAIVGDGARILRPTASTQTVEADITAEAKAGAD